MKLKHPLFLASSSPRRSDILTEAGIPYTLIPNFLTEEPTLVFKDTLATLGTDIMRLAQLKAEVSAVNQKGLVLGVDTTVLFQNKIMGKPATVESAKKGLKLMSGKKQHVLTAYCLFDTISQVKINNFDMTTVWFDDLSEQDIDAYYATSNPLDKAGGYDIRDIQSTFIKKIEGSFTNVVGLPIEKLKEDLRLYFI